ncbi:MAG: twin transmembrane helix small protein [bacterium]
MRYIVIGMFILIVVSLGSALVFIYRDESGSKRAVTALAIRVGLSIALFLMLMAGYYFGLIPGRLTG